MTLANPSSAPDPQLSLPVLTRAGHCCWPETLLILLAAVLHTVAIMQAPPLQSANDRSRWCTVRALLEDGTYQIDRVRQIPGWDTIDLIQRDDHFYSTKPPLMATWVAAVVGGVCAVTGWNFTQHFPQIQTATLLLINGLPFVLGLIGLTWWLRRVSLRSETVLLVLTTAAFGTLLSPFLTSLNNHTPAAMGVLVAALCWWPGEAGVSAKSGLNGWRFLLWGFAASWAACHDLPAAAMTLAMLILAARQNWRLTSVAFVGGAALPAVAFLAANWAALGNIVPAYSGYGGETYRFLYRGVPSYWLQPQGIDRNLDSPWVYAMHCLVGHHGWFLLTPIWGLVLVAGGRKSRVWSQTERRLWWLTMGLSGIVLAFYLTRTGNYNYGGVSCALRWAIFLTPLWLMSLAVVLDRQPRLCWTTTVALPLLAVSIFSAWYPMSRAWQQPWAYQWMSALGWTHPGDRPPAFPVPRYSWMSSLPAPVSESELATESATPIWVEFARPATPDGQAKLRLTYLGDRTIGNRQCAVVNWSQQSPGAAPLRRELLIDRAAVTAGRPPAECLVWTDPQTSLEDKLADLSRFRGLPQLKAYSPGFERYLFLPLRDDAFACQRSAAQCDHPGTPDANNARYRCDLWLSPELPFGTARVEWTASNATTGDQLSREVWTVTACSPAVSSKTPVTVEMFDTATPITRQVAESQQSP